MAIYGYARISTPTQKIERQISNILKFNSEAVIFTEAYTGRSINRPEFNKLMKKIKSGDTIILDEVSRLSRNADEGVAIYQELFNKEINLVFLKEPHINTDTYKNAMTNQVPMTGAKVDLILEGLNRYLLELAKSQIQMAFNQAEKEVEFLRNRTKEGLNSAKANGVVLGRPKGANIETAKSKKAKEII